MRKKRNNWLKALRHAIIIGIGAFFLAILASLVSETLMGKINSIFLGFLLLITIILVGIVFDIIGVGVAAADEVPLHSRSAKKVFGSNQSIKLVRNADRVASFCNDVVGDICGTLSGAVGATLVLMILVDPSDTFSVLAGTLMTAFIAALTVIGKAFGKSFAIANGTEIIFKVGQVLAWLELRLHINLFKERNGEAKKGNRK